MSNTGSECTAIAATATRAGHAQQVAEARPARRPRRTITPTARMTLPPIRGPRSPERC
jgi:hypothetical protein